MNVSVQTLFIGTAQFAVPILKKLATSSKLKEAGLKLIAIITNPDAKAGRKLQLTPPPVKVEAQKLGLEILQPETLDPKPFTFNPDLIILAAYGKILPAWLVSLPPKGALNIHPSLLPKLRGATPIQSTILQGFTETGVTIFLMNEQVDHGPILAQKRYPIEPAETYSSLEIKLANLGAKLLEETLIDWLSGKITPQPQDELQATYAKKIKKEDGHIDWTKPAAVIEKQVRAFEEWPTSFTSWKSQSPNDKLQTNSKTQILKITKVSVLNQASEKNPGTVIEINGKVGVVTGSGVLILERVQPAGKKEMSIEEFIRGHTDFVGAILA